MMRLFSLLYCLLLCLAASAQPDTTAQNKGKLGNKLRLGATTADSNKVVNLNVPIKKDTTQAKPIVTAKDTTSLAPKRKHSPARACVYSAILPGLGQIYNRKWWKAPIVWGAVGTLGYFMVATRRNYVTYRNAYRLRIDTSATTIDQFDSVYSTSTLKGLRDQWQRYSEQTILGFSAIYILNIVDAFVDAHLWDFDVSDDLSAHFKPDFRYNAFTGQSQFSLNLAFKFKPYKAPVYYRPF